ncbi:hypothetical protein R3P38DRAFT_3274142 [Favolaschia claudopus]|uniref:Uncharacterized protein n=1 Tax=Favolaschia claudopus TaxID=2862362 RepID=A0AAW0B3D7_9AGAR
MVTADEQIANLRVAAHLPTDSADDLSLWCFDELPSAITDPTNEITAYISRLKAYWRPQSGLEIPEEWTRIILPPSNPTGPYIPLERWFPLSSISAILSTVSSELQHVPATTLCNRYASAEYVGPLLPVRSPPEVIDSQTLTAMVDILLCGEHPTTVFFRLALLLRGTYDCQLKLRPSYHLPRHFGHDIPSIDFGLVPEWLPLSEDMIRRSAKAPLCFSSPALAIGMLLQDVDGDSSTLTTEDLLYVARATQPHLEALLVARHHRYSEAAISALPPPCIFVIAFRDMTIFIIAQIANRDDTTYRYQSLIVDQLSFPPHFPGEGDGIVMRLRIIVALLTIRGHTDRLASLWDDLIWDPAIVDAELTTLREYTGVVTPNPSDYEDPEIAAWGDMLDHMKLTRGGEEVAVDVGPSSSEIECSKTLVDSWLPGTFCAEQPPELPCYT